MVIIRQLKHKPLPMIWTKKQKTWHSLWNLDCKTKPNPECMSNFKSAKAH